MKPKKEIIRDIEYLEDLVSHCEEGIMLELSSLTPWELNFISQMRDQVSEKAFMTESQCNIMEKIREKILRYV